MQYVNTKEARRIFGVHPNTLRRWEKEGKIKAIRSPGGKRLYDVASLSSVKRDRIVYARVSSRGQKDDLDRQIQYLRTRFPEHELVQDFGSGLNYKRKGLASILERILSGTVEEVVVAHRDRLCRFGFEVLESVARFHNTRLVVLDESQQSPQAELVGDMLSIIHVFSCRLYGLRKYSRKIKEDPDLPKAGESTAAEEVSGAVEVLVQQSS